MKLSSVLKLMLSAAAGVVSAAAMVLLIRREGAMGRRERRRGPLRGFDRTDRAIWRFDSRFQVLPAGKALRIELTAPAAVRWTTDRWNTAHDTRTVFVNGVHVADLPTAPLPPASRVQFTFFWPDVNRWEGQDFEVTVARDARTVGSMSE